jgi:hypothetical protein
MNHSETLVGMRISYWNSRDGNPVAVDENEADTVQIGDCYPSFTFKLPAQDHEFRKLCIALKAAAAYGDGAARADIRKSLGITK